MTLVNDREFEPLVYQAMQARPQPRSISNLAYRAMQLARERTRALARMQVEGLLRLRRRTRWLAPIAGVLITLVVFAGARKLQKPESTGTGSSSIVTETDSASTTNDTWVLSVGLTAELLVVGLILAFGGVSSSRPEPETLFY